MGGGHKKERKIKTGELTRIGLWKLSERRHWSGVHDRNFIFSVQRSLFNFFSLWGYLTLRLILGGSLIVSFFSGCHKIVGKIILVRIKQLLICWPSPNRTQNGNRINTSGQVLIFTKRALDRISAQPKVKLSLLRNISLKRRPMSLAMVDASWGNS